MAQAAALGGAALGAVASIRQGNAEAAAAEANAQMAEQNAALSEAQALEDERRQRIMAKKQLGDIRSGYGASGVSLEGSGLDVLEESASNAELDALSIRHMGQVKATMYRNQAAISRFSGKEAKIGGYLGAAGYALGGAGSLAGKSSPGYSGKGDSSPEVSGKSYSGGYGATTSSTRAPRPKYTG